MVKFDFCGVDAGLTKEMKQIKKRVRFGRCHVTHYRIFYDSEKMEPFMVVKFNNGLDGRNERELLYINFPKANYYYFYGWKMKNNSLAGIIKQMEKIENDFID